MPDVAPPTFEVLLARTLVARELRALAGAVERGGVRREDLGQTVAQLLGLPLEALADEPRAPAEPELPAQPEAAPAPRPPKRAAARAKRKPSRPRKAKASTLAPDVAGPTEAARLVRELVAKYGSRTAVGERFGLNRELLRRWQEGQPASPATVERLRAALASPAPTEVRAKAQAIDAEATTPPAA